MIGRGDFALALGLALALHLGALSLWDAGEAGGGRGAEGGMRVTVAPASPAIRALVAEWETPPEVAAAAALPAPETGPEAAVRLPATGAAPQPAIPARLTAPDMPARAPDVPTRAETLSPPPGADTPPAPPNRTETTPLRTAEPLAAPAPATPRAVDTAPPLPPVETVVESPRPDPRPDSPAVARQAAEGPGVGARAGASVVAATGAPTAADEARAQAAWAATIQSRIARHQVYPNGTRASGRVQVTMVILRDGKLGEVRVARSSGAARLDRAAVLAVERAAPFPPAPDALKDRWFRVGQWITFDRR